MATSGNNYGDIHRYEEARESRTAAVAIVLLTILEIVLVTIFTYGLVTAWATSGIGNMYMGTILALIFLDLAFILLLYRKEFLPDVMIVKKRRRKWEDLYVREDGIEGESLLDGLGDNLKQAVYPFYKR